jgi:propanol-preferring alcohol dehydrogenase
MFKVCTNLQAVGYELNGGHAEYVLVPEKNLLHIPEDITFEAATLIWDGIGASYGSIKRLNVNAKDTVAVFGCGPIGLGAINNCKFLGATVVALDLLKERRDIAKNIGADYTLDPANDAEIKKLKEVNSGFGPDVCLECSGSEAALHIILDVVKPGGKCGLIGELHEVKKIDFSEKIIHRDLTLAGNLTYEHDKVDEIIDLIRRGLNAEKLITHKYALKDSKVAWSLFDEGKTGKVVIYP